MKILRYLFFLTLFSFLFNYLHAQEPSGPDRPFRIGIGVVFPNIIDDFLEENRYPLFYLPIETKYYKIEPEFFFQDGEDKSSYQTIYYKRIRYGIGLFRKSIKENTELYYGIRFGLAQYYHRRKSKSSDSKSLVESESQFISPSIGGEYYFGSYFSLGGEISYSHIISQSEYNYNDNDPSLFDELSNTTGVDIILRYYIK